MRAPSETSRVVWCVAVCCSVLQCVAVCCDVLRCVAVSEGAGARVRIQCATVYYGVSMLQCVSVLHCIIVCRCCSAS